MPKGDDLSNLKGDTVPTMFWRQVVERGPSVAMREKDFGIWQSITWTEFGTRAKHVGLGLVSLGLETGDRVCILSQNNPEWLYTDLGVLGASGVTSGSSSIVVPSVSQRTNAP